MLFIKSKARTREWKIVGEEHKDAVQHGLPPHELYDVLTYPLDLVSELIRESQGKEGEWSA